MCMIIVVLGRVRVKPFSHDHRRLRMVEECQCPKCEIHNTKCSWYHTEIIYILDTQSDLSASEKAAQEKIYHMYLNTLNNPPEYCGCGTAAAIAYMGHNLCCIELQYLHERESCEVLLAILKKRKKHLLDAQTTNPKDPDYILQR